MRGEQGFGATRLPGSEGSETSLTQIFHTALSCSSAGGPSAEGIMTIRTGGYNGFNMDSAAEPVPRSRSPSHCMFESTLDNEATQRGRRSGVGLSLTRAR